MVRSRRRSGLFAALLLSCAGLAPALPGTSHTLAASAATPAKGYWFVAADGGIFSYGDAGFHGSTGAMRLNKPIVGMAPTPSGKGYWFVASDGGVFSYGDAKFYGSTGAMKLNQPIVGMAATPTGKGYWFVASDGGVFSFGDAKFFGSTGAMKLNKPIVGMAATPTGNGYWFVASDGGIFSFGDAKFFGSTGGGALRSQIVGMAATPSGKGYWFVTNDGSIYAYGDAPFYGSMGGKALAFPVVGMTRTPTGGGYWLVASDGGVFSYGDASFYGSTGAIRLNRPIVAMSSVPAGMVAGTPTTNAPGTTGPGGTSPTTGGTTVTTGPDGSTTTTLPPSTGGQFWGTAGTRTRVAPGGNAYRPWMNDNGRFLVYDSDGSGVTPDDDAGAATVRDVFIYDRQANTTRLVSTSTSGVKGNNTSMRATVTNDGRFVAFWSDATNLVAGDTNGVADAFVKDMQTGELIRISVNEDGQQGNGHSMRPVISRDGRTVAFESEADNFVKGSGGLFGGGWTGDGNDMTDVFAYDMVARKPLGRISTSASGAEGQPKSGGEGSRIPSISGNGRLVAFHSDAPNLVANDTNGKMDVFVKNLDSGAVTRVSTKSDGSQANSGSRSASISADGRYVSFDSAGKIGAGDTNGSDDVFVKDLQSGTTTLVSVTAAGGAQNGALGAHDSTISGDGRYVAYWSDATNIVGTGNAFPDVFLRDLVAGTTTRLSTSLTGTDGDNFKTDGKGGSFSPALSVDGSAVAFDSDAKNLAESDNTQNDVYVWAVR